MQFKLKIIILSFLICNLTHGQTSVIGYYSSNFAIAGYTATQIDLRSDLTFLYEMYGHFSYDKTKGTYNTIADTVFLSFDSDKPINISTGSRPTKLLIKDDKLLLLDNNNGIIYKQWGYKDRLFRQRRLKQMNYSLQRHRSKVFEYWKK